MPRRLRRAAVIGGVAAAAGSAGARKGAAAAQQQAAAPQPPQVADVPAEPEAPSMESKTTDLKQLKELLDEGILTQEEFDAQKAQILAT